MKLCLDGRLASAAAFVRGGRLADIGTDHAYLPVSLLLDGKIDYAVASDIKEGPLQRARNTVCRYGTADRMSVVLADGLQGIDSFNPDDIAILGMGGELIAYIINNAEWVKKSHYRFILQPMTRREHLRKYLITHGFLIEDESISEADGRIYQTVCASYCGCNTEYSDTELLLGRQNIARGGELFEKYVGQLISVNKAIVTGKKRSGSDTAEEEKITDALNALIKK